LFNSPSFCSTGPSSGAKREDPIAFASPTLVQSQQRRPQSSDETDGDKKKAASVLKISVKTLYSRLNEYKTD
jgi:DNA-binding NtrC family response regulator